MEQKQKMAAAEGEDTDIFGFYAEPPLVAVNLFHLRNGTDRGPAGVFLGRPDRFRSRRSFSRRCSSRSTSEQQYVPAHIHVPVDFEEREELEEFLSEKRGRKVEIRTPQRGQKKALLAWWRPTPSTASTQRFRVLKPSSKAIQEALQDALNLPDAPRRIECFDISHIQGTDKVASMVVWEDGRMKKADYRKFIIRTVVGNDDFASHARSDHAALLETAGGEAAVAGPGPDRWRPGAVARGRRSARGDRDHGPAARVHRQARRDGSTFTDRKTSRSFSTSSRPFCIWSRPSATRRIALP